VVVGALNDWAVARCGTVQQLVCTLNFVVRNSASVGLV